MGAQETSEAHGQQESDTVRSRFAYMVPAGSLALSQVVSTGTSIRKAYNFRLDFYTRRRASLLETALPPSTLGGGLPGVMTITTPFHC